MLMAVKSSRQSACACSLFTAFYVPPSNLLPLSLLQADNRSGPASPAVSAGGPDLVAGGYRVRGARSRVH